MFTYQTGFNQYRLLCLYAKRYKTILKNNLNLKNLKKINLIKVIIMVTFGVIMTMVVLSSCSNTPTVPTYTTQRILVLENNTVSYVNIPKGLDSVFTYNDTVWVNMLTHRIDDTDSFTMKCVLKPIEDYRNNRGVLIIPADTVEGRKTFNVEFSNGTGLDSMYPEEIAQSLIEGKWLYDEDLKVIHEQN